MRKLLKRSLVAVLFLTLNTIYCLVIYPPYVIYWAITDEELGVFRFLDKKIIPIKKWVSE